MTDCLLARFPCRAQTVHQRSTFAAKHRHIAIDEAPHKHVIHALVLMRELIAEVNDPPRLRYRRERHRRCALQRDHGLADDGELALH